MISSNSSSLMRNALALCQKMATSAIEIRLIARLPVLVDEFGEAHRALRHVDQVRAILAIDAELLDHARPNLHRAVLAAVDEVAQALRPGIDRHGWREVLLEALQVDEMNAENIINLGAYRAASL